MNDEVNILTESIVDFCNGLEALAVNLRRQLKGLAEAKVVLSEETFDILKWVNEKGVRLGDFQVAYKNMNLPDKWLHAYSILKANNSLISNSFKDRGYVYRYWIFPSKYTDRIFRKKIREGKA